MEAILFNPLLIIAAIVWGFVYLLTKDVVEPKPAQQRHPIAQAIISWGGAAVCVLITLIIGSFYLLQWASDKHQDHVYEQRLQEQHQKQSDDCERWMCAE